jgi:hypothetical protein
MRAHEFIPKSNIMTESILQVIDVMLSQTIEQDNDAIYSELYIRYLSNKLEAEPFVKDFTNSYSDTLISLEKFSNFAKTNKQLSLEIAHLTAQYDEFTHVEKVGRLRNVRDGLIKLYKKYNVLPEQE